jgi:hypothetical protein
MTVVTVTLVRMTNAHVLDSAHLVERAHLSRALWSLHSSCTFGTLSANALTSVMCTEPVISLHLAAISHQPSAISHRPSALSIQSLAFSL